MDWRARRARLGSTAIALLVAGALPASGLAAVGDLDPTFGEKGVVQTSVGDGGQAEAGAAAAVPGGGLVAVGKAIDGGATRPALVRYTPTGALDSSFSGDGMTTIPVIGAFSAVTVLGDRSVIAAGQVEEGGQTNALVVKLTPSGELDGGFGAGGIASLPAGDGGSAAALALRVVEGQPVIAGSAVDGGQTKVLVARLTAGGAPDGSFAGGAVLQPLGDGGTAQATGLVSLPGGVLIATGSASDGGGRKLALVQLNAGGAVGATRLVAIGNGLAAEGLAAEASSLKPLVVGSAAHDGKTVMFAARFRAGLQTDELFGKDGVELIPAGDGGNAIASAVTVAGGGRIVLAGRADDALQGGSYLVKTALARLNERGELDESFGPSSRIRGTVLVNIGCDGGEGASGAFVDGDGRTVIAGGSGTASGTVFTLARFVEGQPGGGTGACGGAGVDTPGGGPGGCEPSASIGPLRFSDACFRLVEGGRLEARGTMGLNGLKITTGGGSKLVIDPASSRVYTAADKGALGKGSLQLLAEDIKIYEGSIDISVPSKPFSLEDLVLPKGVSFKGFPLVGKPKLEFDRGSVVVTLPVQLPAPFNVVTGDLKLRADVDRGILWDGLAIRAKQFPLGPILVRDFVISYAVAYDAWEGNAVFVLPFPQRYGAGGGIGFKRGRFAHAEAEVNGLNLPIGKLVFLQRVRFGLGIDPLQIQGGIGISAGPSILGASAVQIDGNMLWRMPDPPVPALLRADGTVRVVEIPIASGFLQYTSDGRFDLGGSVEYGIKPLVYIDAGLSAYVTADGEFQAAARGEMCGLLLPSFTCAEATALVNARWFAACASVKLVLAEFSGGFAHAWGGDTSLFEGCDLSAYQNPAGGTSRLAARVGLVGAPLTFDPPAARIVSVRIKGTGGAVPRIRFTGPGGVDLTSGADPVVRGGGGMLVEDPSGAVIVLLEQPAAGRFTITPLDGSPAIASVQTATPLPKPSVKAKVSGSGTSRLLTYTIQARKGQTVSFVERRIKAKETTLFAPLGEARRTSGRFRFRPADGPAGRREVVAIVEQDGRPRSEIVVASYVAPAPPKPKAVTGLKAARAGKAVVVRFARAKDAVRYAVRVTTDSRRRLYLEVEKPLARFEDAAGDGKAVVSVIAIGRTGAKSKPVVLTLAAKATPTRAVRGTVASVDAKGGRLVLKAGSKRTTLFLLPSTRYRGLASAAAVRTGQRLAIVAEVRSFDRKLLALDVRRLP